MVTTISRSAEETMDFGRAQAAKLGRGDILGLCGELGTGKTHFVKGVAAAVGAPGSVTSPTFTLIHEYLGGRIPIFHFDFYRLDRPEEALQIGLDEYLEGEGVCLIEWADKFPGLLPPRTRWLRFLHQADGGRLIQEEE